MNFQQYMENVNARFENLAAALDEFNTVLNKYITGQKPAGAYELTPVKIKSEVPNKR